MLKKQNMFACSPGPLVPRRVGAAAALQISASCWIDIHCIRLLLSTSLLMELEPPCTFGVCFENQRVNCFLFVCKISSRYPASVHVALKFDTSMLHDEMLSLCAFCIQCFVNIFVPIKIQRVTGFQSIDACMVDAGCRSRAIGHSACILCSVIRMKFQCDRALGMHVFHAFNIHDEYLFMHI